MNIPPEVWALAAGLTTVVNGYIGIQVIRERRQTRLAVQPGDNLANLINVLQLSLAQSQQQHADNMARGNETSAALKQAHTDWRASFDAQTSATHSFTAVLEADLQAGKDIKASVKALDEKVGERMTDMEGDIGNLKEALTAFETKVDERFEGLQKLLDDARMKTLLEDMRRQLVTDMKAIIAEAIAQLPGNSHPAGLPAAGPDAAPLKVDIVSLLTTLGPPSVTIEAAPGTEPTGGTPATGTAQGTETTPS